MHALTLTLWLTAHAAAALPPLQTGDLVFHTSRSEQARAIQVATHSPLTHVGLLEVTPRGTFVIEAVQPVRRVRLEAWRARGRGGRLLVLRPEGLTAAERARTLEAARRQLGKPYDARFGWGDDALYCSELVHKALLAGTGRAYGARERLGDLDLARLGPALRRRYGGRVPRELALLTPVALARAPGLALVYSDFASLR